MKYPKILVTGATGRTGSAVVDELLAKGVPVRALVHSKDARSAALERKGAETVVADMFDLDQLLAPMHGTHRAYYLPFYDPCLIQSAATFAIAAQEAAGSSSEPGPVVGEPATSLAHNAASLARRPGFVHDAGRGTRESEPGILCRQLSAAD